MRSIVVVACVGLCGIAFSSPTSFASPQQKKGQGKVVGAVWEFEAKKGGKTGEVIEQGRFRATLDGRIYGLAGKEIGSYRYTNKAKDKVTLNITGGKLKGTIDLVKVGLESPSWVGTWKMQDGTSAHLHIKMLRD